MPRKGKTQKHTAAEIAAKVKASKEANGAAGGGGAMAKARKEAGNKASISCDVCKSLQPSMASMKQHYESKHSKLPWTTEMEADYKARQIAARGTAKPKKVATHRGGGGDSKSKSKSKKEVLAELPLCRLEHCCGRYFFLPATCANVLPYPARFPAIWICQKKTKGKEDLSFLDAFAGSKKKEKSKK